MSTQQRTVGSQASTWNGPELVDRPDMQFAKLGALLMVLAVVVLAVTLGVTMDRSSSGSAPASAPQATPAQVQPAPLTAQEQLDGALTGPSN